MSYFAGLDIGLERTAVCVVDADGRRVAEAQVTTEPELLVAWLRGRAEAYERVGLEACPLSDWPHDELTAAGLPVVCLETHHLRATLAAMTHKTDRNDARGIAQVVRTGWFRPVHAKSRHSRELRALPVSRQLLPRQALKLENSVRGTLKAFGYKLPRGGRRHFEARVLERLGPEPTLPGIVRPPLEARGALLAGLGALHRQLLAAARQDPACRRMMTVPGVGPVTAMAFRMAADDPARFRRSKAVGAVFGLVPRKHQSGGVDRDGHITRAGDGLVRAALHEAATTLLARVSKASRLRTWATGLAKRVGARRARVAVARELAVVPHRLRVDGAVFRPGPEGAPMPA
jgi:transposase